MRHNENQAVRFRYEWIYYEYKKHKIAENN